MRGNLPVIKGAVVGVLVAVTMLGVLVLLEGVKVADAQSVSSKIDTSEHSEMLAMDADKGTIVVTVCGLAVMVLSESEKTRIMLGSSMASHLSEMGIDTGVQSGQPLGALELADHYNSIRDNCKAVRKTNDKDALNDRLEIDKQGVGKDELI